MKASTIQWHLVRDSRVALHKFCEKNKVNMHTGPIYTMNGVPYFTQLYHFDNDGYIRVELRAGTINRGYTVADGFDVVDYSVGL